MEFRFQCQPDCSRCCQVEGQVYLSEEDVKRIAAHLNFTPKDFEARYVYRTTQGHIRLRKPVDRQCHFHRNNQCSIHGVKPTQCRTFPYWPELVENEAAWNDTAKYCPGIGQGELVRIETATAIADEMYRAYPTMYPEKLVPER